MICAPEISTTSRLSSRSRFLLAHAFSNDIPLDRDPTISRSSFGNVFGRTFSASMLIHSFICGGTVAVERTRSVGSTRKKHKTVRLPCRVGSGSSNGRTRCCRVFSHAKARPEKVRDDPRGCTQGPWSRKLNTFSNPVSSFCSYIGGRTAVRNSIRVSVMFSLSR